MSSLSEHEDLMCFGSPSQESVLRERLARAESERDHAQRMVHAAVKAAVGLRVCPPLASCGEALLSPDFSYAERCPKCWSDYLDTKAKEAPHDA